MSLCSLHFAPHRHPRCSPHYSFCHRAEIPLPLRSRESLAEWPAGPQLQVMSPTSDSTTRRTPLSSTRRMIIKKKHHWVFVSEKVSREKSRSGSRKSATSTVSTVFRYHGNSLWQHEKDNISETSGFSHSLRRNTLIFVSKEKRSEWKRQSIHERSRKIFKKFSRKKLKRQFEEKMRLRENHQKLKRMWKLEDGSKEVQKLLQMNLIENSTLKDYSIIKRTYGLTMLTEKRTNVCGELERRNKFFQESRTKDCQEIEELRSRCCEESDRTQQAKLEELSIMQQRNLQTVSQLLAQSREVQEKANSLPDAREFHDPETASSSRASHVAGQPLTIPSSRKMLGRDSGLPPSTRDTVGISGNVFERQPAQQGHPQDHFGNSVNLASSCRGVKPKFTEHTMTKGSKMRPEQQDLSNSRNVRHTGGTYSHGGMMEYPRFSISELHLAKFPDSMEFQSWKVNFKTELCAKTANPQITMSWITKVEKANSIDELMTSQTIVGEEISQIMTCWMWW